ncbi:uncharacterized protein LOC123869159 [Maniola jurtina]|uniref:uncharacterized protein LOC123869159 n=1 Tax=Maniola jurtina TaxID=191418 RepID=UPI001E688D65|nr:uncharacterized protein LOC123869159 [Maniola jurtina]
MDKISVGLLTVFNHETQEWELYKGRIEQWFLANEIDDDADKTGAKRRAILLSSCAETTYKLIRDLALPNDVSSLSYAQVVSLLDGHFKAKKCGFAERYKFHSACQGNSESLSAWAARVRGLAKDCSFPAAVLNEMLRDRFVLGMGSGKVRERLFEKSLEGLTMEKALQWAESVHCANEGARQAAMTVQPSQDLSLSPFVEVHKVTSRQPRSSQGRQAYSAEKESASRSVPVNKKKCVVCNSFGHGSQICRYRSFTCRVCGVKGHIQRACGAVKGRDSQHFLQFHSDAQGDDDDVFTD